MVLWQHMESVYPTELPDIPTLYEPIANEPGYTWTPTANARTRRRISRIGLRAVRLKEYQTQFEEAMNRLDKTFHGMKEHKGFLVYRAR